MQTPVVFISSQRQRRVQLAAIESEATAKREEETKRLKEITSAAQAEEQKGH